MKVSSKYSKSKNFDPHNRHAFKGDSCYPISPINLEENKQVSNNDQLNKILQFINPSDHDLSYLADENQA